VSSSTLAALLAAAPVAPVAPSPQLGGGETVVFWVLAPVMVLAALGLLFVKKAVHAAMLVALVMVCLAVLYAAQDAPFLFAAQVVVYTGAVMMLFLFVLMLVGVDTSDSLVETVRGQRVAGVLAGLGLALLLVSTVTGIDRGPLQWRGFPDLAPGGLEEANADGNPVGVARLVFGEYVFAFEIVGTLLITAALGAILLTHRERLTPARTQASMARDRVRRNSNVPPLPAPGVFARSNAVDTPALLPDGTPSELSISRVLRARGQEQTLGARERHVAVLDAEIRGARPIDLVHGWDAEPHTGGPGDAVGDHPSVPLAGKRESYATPVVPMEGPASEGSPPVARQPDATQPADGQQSDVPGTGQPDGGAGGMR
jgi:NADH-quinone oxidoreductase subunit J